MRVAGRDQQCRRRLLVSACGVAAMMLAAVISSGAAPARGALPADADKAAARTPGLRSFTVAATGDVLTEAPVLAAGQRYAASQGSRYDFSPLFAPVASMISSAHLAICHMEIPVGRVGERPGVYGRSPYGGNLLLAPNEIVDGLRQAGFDRCTTSSNHSFDLGVGGIDSTLDVLDSAGLTHVGTARTAEEQSQLGLLVVNGVRVAHLAYTRTSNTDKPRDAWRLNYAYSAQQVIDDVHRARAAGAEVVIVSVHIGLELQRGPSAGDRAFITEFTSKSDVDLVIEHGPHVVQPIEQVNGTWVYWSVGNFVSGMGQPGATRYGPPTLDGLLAWIRFDETSPGEFSVTPSSVLICNEIYGRVVYPAIVTLTDPTLAATLRQQLEACLGRTVSLVPDVS